MTDREQAKPSLDNGNFLFRFRSAKALLDDDDNGGFQELEKQAIYFAKPEQLNDPMEGLSDAFWDGDDVLWENFFKHYALALISYALKWLLHEPDEIQKAKVDAWLTAEDLPTDMFRSLYREFCSDLSSVIEARELAQILGRRTLPLRRERLINLLFLVHQAAVPSLFLILKKHRLVDFELPPEAADTKPVKTTLECWEEIASAPSKIDMPVEEQLEVLSSITNRVSHQLDLGVLTRIGSIDEGHKLLALMSRFPEMYVDAFSRDLHFNPWRVACFSRRCTNASMWGTYGSEHRGAALIFRTEQREGEHYFRIKGMAGTADSGADLKVHNVEYGKRPPPLDSFNVIGRLPLHKLKTTWMVTEDGRASTRLSEMTDDLDAWRTRYWNHAFKRVSWKHFDWEHEEERRLVASSVLADDPAPEALTYDFSQLEGLVFGMRMSSEDKLRTASIVEKKCRATGRTDFRFFQAYYSPSKGEMDIAELGLLKFDIGK